ncbi:MAG: DUF4214 domain-containing protein, partial [Desulfobacterales bacterium]
MVAAKSTGPEAVQELSQEIALGFLQSQEYVLRDRNDRDFLEDLYNGILRRGADPAEFEGWMDYINGGWTREQVLQAFVNSEEFQLRVQAYINSGVSALSLPERITLSNVDSSDSTIAASLKTISKTAKSMQTRAFNDLGTQYTAEPKSIWVEDTDALDLINDILGVVQDSGYQYFVNAGPYKALVKEVDDNDQSQSGASTTSATTEQLMEITLDVTRTDNNAPMIIKVWVLENDGPGGAAMRIRGHFTVTKGVNPAYPYGQMEAHFKGSALDNNGSELPGDPIFVLALRVDSDADGHVLVESVDIGDETQGEFGYMWNNKVRLVANSDLTMGNAYIDVYESWNDEGGSGEDQYTSYIAFNENYFKELEGGEVAPTVLDKNNFHQRIYRYKLFKKSDGSKVTRNAGFPIRLASGLHAYIGYYGLWAPQGAAANDGDQVSRLGNDATYTLVRKGGKLKKHTKAEIGLEELSGVEMSFYRCNDQGCSDYIIAWDKTTELFNKIGRRNQENGQIEYYPTPYETVTFTEWEGAWCEALNSYLPLGRLYKDDLGQPKAPANTDTVYYHAEETFIPNANMTLYYWGPAPGQNQDTYWMDFENMTEKTYTFDVQDLVLKDENGDPILDSESEFGTYLSPLTIGHYTREDCWQAHDADIYYTWETGSNEWNQFTAIKDPQGEIVAFEAPLRFTYTHSTANDLNGVDTHNGKKFSIEYDGFELHIPFEFDADEGEWQPIINLKDGTVLVGSNGTEYVLKGTEGCLRMQPAADPNAAAGLEIVAIDPPTLAYDSTKTDLVGDLPTDVELKII